MLVGLVFLSLWGSALNGWVRICLEFWDLDRVIDAGFTKEAWGLDSVDITNIGLDECGCVYRRCDPWDFRPLYYSMLGETIPSNVVDDSCCMNLNKCQKFCKWFFPPDAGLNTYSTYLGSSCVPPIASFTNHPIHRKNVAELPVDSCILQVISGRPKTYNYGTVLAVKMVPKMDTSTPAEN